MQHNSKPRLNIPYDPNKQESRDTIEKKYKGVAARLLKLYTDDRAKKWGSLYGVVTNTLKETWSSVSGFFGYRKSAHPAAKLTPENITTFHDSLIKEIIYLTKYEDYIKLIEKLNTAAEEAYLSSSYRCLRTDVYFAIIQLLQEAIQLIFPAEYQKDITALRARYKETKKDYDERFDSSREILEICKEREDILVQLVLRGDRSIYKKAFNPGRKIFSYLAPVDSKEIGTHIDFLNKQFLQEDKRKVNISHNELINTNLPMPIQRYFARLLYKLAFDMKRMDDLVANAMDDTELMKGNMSLYFKYLQTKSEVTSQITHEPPDMNDLLNRDESPDGSPQRSGNDNNIATSPTATAALSAVSPSTQHPPGSPAGDLASVKSPDSDDESDDQDITPRRASFTASH